MSSAVFEPEISIHVDRNRLEAYRIPLAAVTEAIRNYYIGEPAGQIRGRRAATTPFGSIPEAGFRRSWRLFRSLLQDQGGF
jgi:multidrug efflux pump subunit AcrB